MPSKKKILWSSDFSKLFTGFGKNSRNVLKYLYDTGKYEIIEYVCAPYTFEDPRLKSVPWKAYGAMPEDPFILSQIRSNPLSEATANYGAYYIDEIVQKEQPDCFIGVQDFWAFKDYYDKTWWNQVNCALWVTLDSLPIFDDAIANAHKIKNFWVWSKFAETEMKRLGFPQVQTLHGAFDTSYIFPFDSEKKKDHKKRFGLKDDFIFGFVFRNQGRKLIGTLIEGFSIFKKKNPSSTAKLLLHTSWREGWDISKFIKEFGVDPSDVLTSHICVTCKNFDVKPHTGENVPCRHCGNPKGLVTPNGGYGVSEGQLNEIYNLMDFYIHPITSGGLEMPLVESLLAGIPIATVDYSCGEEFCENDFVEKIEYSTYRELGSQFIKSQPYAKDISRIMEKSIKENLVEKSSKGREWALKEFDLFSICKRIEDWIDSCPAVEKIVVEKKNSNDEYPFKENIESDLDWTIDLLSGVFGYSQSVADETVQRILQQLKTGEGRKSIYEKAINSASNWNDNKRKTDAKKFFSEDDVERICFIAPESLDAKIISGNFLKKLEQENGKVFLVGTAVDSNIYSQFAKFTLLPPNKNGVDWFRNMKSISGKFRFKRIYFKNGNEIQYVENKQK